MNNVVILNKNPEMGKKIINYFQSKGIDTREIIGDLYIYYGVINGVFDCYTLQQVLEANAKITALPNEYPKVMWVWNYEEEDPVRRVVIAHKQNMFIAWSEAKTLKESEKIINTFAWNYAKDIEEETVLELTIQDISEGKGVGHPPHLIRVKQ